MGAVQYPSLPGSATQAAPGYAAYPQVADVSQPPIVALQTELFMDYYSDVSRYETKTKLLQWKHAIMPLKLVFGLSQVAISRVGVISEVVDPLRCCAVAMHAAASSSMPRGDDVDAV